MVFFLLACSNDSTSSNAEIGASSNSEAENSVFSSSVLSSSNCSTIDCEKKSSSSIGLVDNIIYSSSLNNIDVPPSPEINDISSSSHETGMSSSSWTKSQLLNPDIAYGEMTDSRDGKNYKIITIGTQKWMAENLNYRYTQKTNTLDSSSWCHNNEVDSCTKYGRLYLWSAAMDSAHVLENDETGSGCGYAINCQQAEFVQGVCPAGWHLPSIKEWQDLLEFIESSSNEYSVYINAGKKLKSKNSWIYGHSSDYVGFSAIPAGSYSSDLSVFGMIGLSARFWSSTDKDQYYAYRLALNGSNDDADLINSLKNEAYSVRCLKDF